MKIKILSAAVAALIFGAGCDDKTSSTPPKPVAIKVETPKPSTSISDNTSFIKDGGAMTQAAPEKIVDPIAVETDDHGKVDHLGKSKQLKAEDLARRKARSH